MKNYAITVRITAVLILLSFPGTLILHYLPYGNEADFWCNIFLSIFGSGLLTFISSYIGYITEKKKALEAFFYSTLGLLHILNKYELYWNIERKIAFFIDYVDVDKSLWDIQLGNIYFLNDYKNKNFNYIYEKIYLPLFKFNQLVEKREFNLKWYEKDDSKDYDIVMCRFVEEIEDLLIERKIVTQMPDSSTIMDIPYIHNKLVKNILRELNGKYSEIMNGMKQINGEDS